MNISGLNYDEYQQKVRHLNQVVEQFSRDNLRVIASEIVQTYNKVKACADLLSSCLSSLHTDEIQQSETLRLEYEQIETVLTGFHQLATALLQKAPDIASIESLKFFDHIQPLSLSGLNAKAEAYKKG